MKKSPLGKNKFRELTKSEFILITLIILILEAYLSYNYLILPKWEKYKESSEKLSQKTELANRLEMENMNIKKLVENEKVLKYKLNKLARTLPPYISQEDIILTLGQYSQLRGVIIKSITFDNDNIFAIENFFKNSNSKGEQSSSSNSSNNSNSSSSSGQNSSSNSSSNVQNQMPINSPTVITKYINVKFNGSVTSIYNFIDDLEKNEKKIVVKEIKINAAKGNILTGDMKLQYVAYKEDSNIPGFKIDMPEIEGKTSPFKPYSGYKEENENIGFTGEDSLPKVEGSADIFLDINKKEDDMPKYVMGKTNRPDTEVYFNSNDKIKGKLKIEKKDNNYVYTYNLGDLTKTVTSSINDVDGIIHMVVNSNPVPSEEDKVSIVLDVENKTDSELQIAVKNEDITMPRFMLGNKSGKVSLK